MTVDFIFLSGSIQSDLPTGLHIFRRVERELVRLSSTETGGSAGKVKVIEDYAFIADGAGGLKVVDWTDPHAHSFPLPR